MHAVRQACWMLLLVLPGGAQNSPQLLQRPIPRQLDQLAPSGFDLPGSFEEERQLRLLNADRQKSLVADTNKLLKLARELNSEVGEATAGAPTPAQLRKVAEIEKLARNVKEKMSTSVRGIPVYAPPIAVPIH
jgi:hypothetical protein